MNKDEILQNELFENGSENNTMKLVIEDKNEIRKYKLDEIKNKVILGDTFKVLKKIDDECVDMVFMDPPYFLQLPNKELKRWTVNTKVEGVNDHIFITI
ncbi:MAG TPA: hypothetical protein P5545_05275 [Bacteroidota bacterium]|nr:hypothetical protein [Candidatus Kapabacteria bacterium]HRS01943.1 hypothetical protein [Bacteroidota bacterium]